MPVTRSRSWRGREMERIMNTRIGVTVGVDGSASALRAVRWAAREAASRGVGLRIVHASPHYPELGSLGQLPSGITQREWPLTARRASTVAERARRLAQTVEPGIVVATSVITGPRSRTLIECSGEAGLLVIAARGLDGFAGLHLGSVAGTVSTYARCPVVVVRRRPVPEGSGQPAPVVVGIDGSPPNQLAVGVAVAFADRRDLPLVAVHSCELADNAERVLAEAFAGWSEHYPNVYISRVLRTDPAIDALLSYSPQAELVVVGSRRRGGFTGILHGSTSQSMVRYGSGPVAVVHPSVEPADAPNGHRAVRARS